MIESQYRGVLSKVVACFRKKNGPSRTAKFETRRHGSEIQHICLMPCAGTYFLYLILALKHWYTHRGLVFVEVGHSGVVDHEAAKLTLLHGAESRNLKACPAEWFYRYSKTGYTCSSATIQYDMGSCLLATGIWSGAALVGVANVKRDLCTQRLASPKSLPLDDRR